MSCILSNVKMLLFPFYLICPVPGHNFSLPSKYLLAFSRTARHPQLHGITYILFHIKKSDITWKKKKKKRKRQPISKHLASLPWRAAKARLNLPSPGEHAHWKPTECCWGNTVGSLQVWTAILFSLWQTAYYRGSERETIFDLPRKTNFAVFF